MRVLDDELGAGFEIQIPVQSGNLDLRLLFGSTTIFVGANGAGKSRLATFLELDLEFKAHRISGHRSLAFDANAPKIKESKAKIGLQTGYEYATLDLPHRSTHRWSQDAAVSMLNDYKFVIQSLFADQSKVTLENHRLSKSGVKGEGADTKFEMLTRIWEKLLPHRKLDINGDDVRVVGRDQNLYPASSMSDGERALFYLIGQTLLLEKASVLIVDEPELHIHRSIMSKLWDELETVRSDCCFVFLTHDLDFAAKRVAQKYVLSDYTSSPQGWSLEKVPENTGFTEELTTLMLGSRQPILFVEGASHNLEAAIYRACFPDWTVIHKGSCEHVIHAVVTFRANSSLTRIKCFGIIDADSHSEEDVKYLREKGVAVLPVSEIENLILLPEISREIALHEGYKGIELTERLDDLKADIFATLTPKKIEEIVASHCKRRIDALLKKMDLSGANNVEEIEKKYDSAVTGLNILKIANQHRERLNAAISSNDLSALLAAYDNKGLLSFAASRLRSTKLDKFEAWLSRVLREDLSTSLISKIRSNLPEIEAL